MGGGIWLWTVIGVLLVVLLVVAMRYWGWRDVATVRARVEEWAVECL